MNKPRPLEEEIGADDYSQGVNTGIFSATEKVRAGSSPRLLKNPEKCGSVSAEPLRLAFRAC